MTALPTIDLPHDWWNIEAAKPDKTLSAREEDWLNLWRNSYEERLYQTIEILGIPEDERATLLQDHYVLKLRAMDLQQHPSGTTQRAHETAMFRMAGYRLHKKIEEAVMRANERSKAS